MKRRDPIDRLEKYYRSIPKKHKRKVEVKKDILAPAFLGAVGIALWVGFCSSHDLMSPTFVGSHMPKREIASLLILNKDPEMTGLRQ